METKKRIRARMVICIAILCICIYSCSKSEETREPEVSISEILVEESPWFFFRYENSFIEADGGSGFLSQNIEDDMNEYIKGVSFTFNAEGIGFLEVPEQDREDWVWSLSDNLLTTISNSQTDHYTFFSADRNQMTIKPAQPLCITKIP